ncbi:MAG TPA: DUF5134 domain-containing protein [Actinoplanes sp.]|jgi:hypothetical protein
MVVPVPLQWLLTLALAGGAVFHLGRAARPRLTHEHRIAESLHAVMGLAMVAMLWPFGRVVPGSAWLVVFAGSAGWFAAQASRAGRQWVVPVYFASTAAAMVWMSSAVPATPAMDMPGMTHAPNGPAVWAAAAIGGYLVAGGLCWLLSGLRLGALRTGPPETARCETQWPALCHGVMGVSMGLAMLTMI